MNKSLLWLSLLLSHLNTALIASATDAIQPTKFPPPSFVGAPIEHFYYSGESNDLLFGGLSRKDLFNRKLPDRSLKDDYFWYRKVAYFHNITALLDTTIDGGYGRLYGPKASQVTIAGHEYSTYSSDENNRVATQLMLQIPDNFDTRTPCLVVSASSGSRGIFGAVGTTGSWALINRCAIAYTDKGTATGFFFPDDNAGYDLKGEYQKSYQANLLYEPELSKKDQRFIKAHPDAILTKHAYSQNNLEALWGQYVLQAAEYGLYQLNQHFLSDLSKQVQFTKSNTIVIAASISNGGSATIRAAEQDHEGLIDAIVVAEPNVYVPKNSSLVIATADGNITSHSQNGFDYFVLLNLYSPCATLSHKSRTQPFSQHTQQATKGAKKWCSQLAKDGYLKLDSEVSYPEQAQSIIESNGIMESQTILRPLSQMIQLWPALAATYANQFSQSSIGDNLCGVYFSNKKMNPIDRVLLAATSNGIPPTAKASLALSSDKTSYHAAKCFFESRKNSLIRANIQQVEARINLQNKPAIIVHGRDDNLIAPNHSSRAYYANHQMTRPHVNLKYYEITHAQHFDAFISLPQFADKFIPLHYYYEKSLTLMLKHLRQKTPLPPSQVIKTSTRQIQQNKQQPLLSENLPAIKAQSTRLIKIQNNKLIIP